MRSIKNITTLVLVGAMAFMNACDPIEERDELVNTYDPDNIELAVEQTANGKGNGLTLKMNTPGLMGYWNYILDSKYTDEHYVVFPFTGTHTLTYSVATPFIKDGDPGKREMITKSIEVTIDELDQPLPPDYYDLVGANLEGKTWIFDRANTNWWFMSPNPGGGGTPLSVWWNASECCAPSDQAGKMVFDLNGGPNYTYYKDAAGEPAATGTFRFNADYTKFYIGGGPNILGADGTTDVNGCAKSLSTFGEFEIVELTADKMVLYIPDASCTSGWTWVFVPEQ